MEQSLKAAWQVTAGVIPGTPIDEYTKTWYYTSEEYENQGPDLFLKKKDEAYEYAKLLNDPQYLNWVKVEWIWF